jgi:1D-myo-inositol-tetrakisphosphate 5-kinase/inositol-polyphosphate multikinase
MLQSFSSVVLKRSALIGACCAIGAIIYVSRRKRLSQQRESEKHHDHNKAALDVAKVACPRGSAAVKHGHHLKRGLLTFPDGAPKATDMGEQQVGGHKTAEGKVGMLLHPPNFVLKAVQSRSRGLREVGFYEEVEARRGDSRALESLCGLERFFPQYHGVVQLGLKERNEQGKNLPPCPSGDFLVCLDATAGMRRPCVIDIKIGRVTFEPDSSTVKREKELAKYPRQSEAGFRFVGSRVFRRSHAHDFDRGEFITVGKKVCLTVAPEEGLSFMRDFFTAGIPDAVARASAVGEVAARVRELTSSFESQVEFTFTSSSVLIVYDAAADDDDCGAHTPTTVDVRFIDFAHVRAAHGRVDESTLFGLQRLRGLLLELHAELCEVLTP